MATVTIMRCWRVKEQANMSATETVNGTRMVYAAQIPYAAIEGKTADEIKAIFAPKLKTVRDERLAIVDLPVSGIVNLE